jgi:hypothetical protein
VTLRNEIIKECWDGESTPFKAEVVAVLENEHSAALAAYEIAASGDTPDTADEHQM